MGERRQRTLVQPLAFEQHPFFEGRAVVQKELIEETSTVQRGGMLRPLRARSTGLGMAMEVLVAGGEVIAEGDHVDLVVPLRFERGYAEVLWDEVVLTPDERDPQRATITLRRRIRIPWWPYWSPTVH